MEGMKGSVSLQVRSRDSLTASRIWGNALVDELGIILTAFRIQKDTSPCRHC